MIFHRLKNRMRALGRSSRIIKFYTPIMRQNPNFQVNRVERGFSPRGSVDVNDSMLGRIVDAYNLAKDQQKRAPLEYQVSNEWIPIYKAQFRDSMEALERRDLTKIRQMYRNFFRNPVSSGLHGMPVNMQKSYFSGKITKRAKLTYLIDALYRYEHWKKLCVGENIKILSRPDIGNPYGIEFDGTFITPGVEYQHYYAKKVLSLNPKARPTILELGGGYGGFAYYIKKIQDSARYIGIDLPEVLALATFYLMAAFPEKRFVLFGEEAGIGGADNADFVLLPNFQITVIPPGEVDVIFNSYSLAEMSRETIRTYVREFGRIAAPSVMHVNHVTHAVLGADAFGFEEAGFRLQERHKALWNMGRQLDMDEYEFVYRRP